MTMIESHTRSTAIARSGGYYCFYFPYGYLEYIIPLIAQILRALVITDVDFDAKNMRHKSSYYVSKFPIRWKRDILYKPEQNISA